MLYANRALERMTGYTAADFQFPQADNPFVHRDDAARVGAFIAEFLTSGREESAPIDNRFCDRWGQTQWFRSVLSRIRFDGCDAIQFVTRRVERGEPAASEHELLRDYRALVQSAGDGIIKLDAEGRFLFCNARFLEIAGRDAVELGHTCASELVHPGDGATARCRFLEPGRFDTRFVRPGGEAVSVEVVVTSLEPGREVLALVRDVTEQRRLEREVRQHEKLQSLGLFAGGVAHDLNGLLATMQVYVTLAEEASGRGGDLRPLLHDLRHACATATSLCTRVLTAAGEGPIDRATVDLGRLVEDAVTLVSTRLPSTTAISLRRAEARILGDPAGLEPVVMNLVSNAAEAIGERGGRIDVEVGVCDVDARTIDDCEVDGGLSPGRYAFLRVSDDGPGIDPATRARMFDPFFTTKTRGHGLGLASVLRTVRDHQGGIAVDGASGRGTSVTVFLAEDPAAASPGDAPVAAMQSAATQSAATQRAATQSAAQRAATQSAAREASPARLVLVADDEPALRRSLVLLLTGAGYETVEARDGVEALALADARADELAFALVDAQMPRMSGAELVAALRERWPRLPIALMSGQSASTSAGDASGAPPIEGVQRVERVSKPFDPGDLLRLLERSVRRRDADARTGATESRSDVSVARRPSSR